MLKYSAHLEALLNYTDRSLYYAESTEFPTLFDQKPDVPLDHCYEQLVREACDDLSLALNFAWRNRILSEKDWALLDVINLLPASYEMSLSEIADTLLSLEPTRSLDIIEHFDCSEGIKSQIKEKCKSIYESSTNSCRTSNSVKLEALLKFQNKSKEIVRSGKIIALNRADYISESDKHEFVDLISCASINNSSSISKMVRVYDLFCDFYFPKPPYPPYGKDFCNNSSLFEQLLNICQKRLSVISDLLSLTEKHNSLCDKCYGILRADTLVEITSITKELEILYHALQRSYARHEYGTYPPNFEMSYGYVAKHFCYPYCRIYRRLLKVFFVLYKPLFGEEENNLILKYIHTAPINNEIEALKLDGNVENKQVQVESSLPQTVGKKKSNAGRPKEQWWREDINLSEEVMTKVLSERIWPQIHTYVQDITFYSEYKDKNNYKEVKGVEKDKKVKLFGAALIIFAAILNKQVRKGVTTFTSSMGRTLKVNELSSVKPYLKAFLGVSNNLTKSQAYIKQLQIDYGVKYYQIHNNMNSILALLNNTRYLLMENLEPDKNHDLSMVEWPEKVDKVLKSAKSLDDNTYTA